ncbi:hypothetical protein DICPUDRAFT_157090 [Dictyostelium purpureum]|uniref:Uncharacterized protein n=1 Tax=Dictyostelium purpureum TaxID=5786 RepID=F0ZY83_DICPU|nr:uncharacterized protein DICPUDRAFT_157090 [Dictyostelium purpureum]EGC31104.1 hypothetical protein DICPUDRAFT_157090 [Dictyostelium purpureum]|eukprot:XP_003292381.1 hypothetical protein DICPUDRAFT_157090 [Dictyostelium purpureum]
MKYLNIFVILVLFVFGCVNADSSSANGVNLLSVSTLQSFNQINILNSDNGVSFNHTFSCQGNLEDVLFYDDNTGSVLLMTRSGIGFTFYLYSVDTVSLVQVGYVPIEGGEAYMHRTQRYVYNSQSKTVYLVVSTPSSPVNILEIEVAGGKMNFIPIAAPYPNSSPSAIQAFDAINSILYITYIDTTGGVSIVSVDTTTYTVIKSYSTIDNVFNGLVNFMFTNQNGQLFLVKPTRYSQTSITICRVDFGTTENTCADLLNVEIGDYTTKYQPYIVNGDNSKLMLIMMGTSNNITTTFNLNLLDINNNFTSELVNIPIDNNWYLSSEIYRFYFNF